jgi:hypothetical protein
MTQPQIGGHPRKRERNGATAQDLQAPGSSAAGGQEQIRGGKARAAEAARSMQCGQISTRPRNETSSGRVRPCKTQYHRPPTEIGIAAEGECRGFESVGNAGLPKKGADLIPRLVTNAPQLTAHLGPGVPLMSQVPHRLTCLVC